VTKGPSQATLLVELALETDGFETFHTPAGDAYLMLPSGTHRECWPVKSTAVRRWLSRLYFVRARVAPGGQALSDALSVLEGQALYEGAEHDAHLRVTAGDDGAVRVDLADEHWQAVETTSFARNSNSARSARCLAAPIRTSRPSWHITIGPRTPNSTITQSVPDARNRVSALPAHGLPRL
jgi:hypothetical protein